MTWLAEALLDPNMALPSGISVPRFAIYRNGVTHGLTAALAVNFPCIRKLVGPDFFAAMAIEFLRRHPPKTRMMMLYGDKLAGFLTNFPPVADYPYLADIARLEQAQRESYHAADAAPVADGLLLDGGHRNSPLQLAPSLRLVRSDWPIFSIWRANMAQGEAPLPVGEDVLILRPDFDPELHSLTRRKTLIIEALLQGKSPDELHALMESEADLTNLLALLIRGKAIVGLGRA